MKITWNEFFNIFNDVHEVLVDQGHGWQYRKFNVHERDDEDYPYKWPFYIDNRMTRLVFSDENNKEVTCNKNQTHFTVKDSCDRYNDKIKLRIIG